MFDESKIFFAELFGFGDPSVEVLNYFYSRKDELVSIKDLQCQFGNKAQECVSVLLKDGYIAGKLIPNGADTYNDASGKLVVKPRPFRSISPYHITIRGISRLKELRRNRWVFWLPMVVSLISLIVSIFKP